MALRPPPELFKDIRDFSRWCLTADKLPEYLVADLPEGKRGDRVMVLDATAPTFLGTFTGGGAVATPAVHNGTTWVAG